MSDKTTYAVLTGDIVKSSKMTADDLAAVRDLVTQSVSEAGRWKRGFVRGKADFFRGDSWQAVVAKPAMALRIAIYVRARLISFDKTDSRIAIGLGGADKLSTTRASLSSGTAFEISGRALDGMKRARLAITAESNSYARLGALETWLPAAAGLLDAIISDWTARQAEIITEMLWPLDRTQALVATDLDITQQTVAAALDGAHWSAVSDALDAFEATEWGSK